MPRTSSGRRYEFWSNAFTEVTDWTGYGQPKSTKSHPATEWTLLFYPMNPTERHTTQKFCTRDELMAVVDRS